MIRSVYEGVAFNTRWLLTYVEKFTKRRLEVINIVGGGANSAIWCQIFADVLDRTIRRVEDPVATTVRGAGMIGAIGLGLLDVADVAERVNFDATFQPNPQHRGVYDRQFDAFLELYKRNWSIYRRLNQ